MNTQTNYKTPVECTDEEYINICFKGDNELGKLLSHFTYSPFIHPYYGPFNSMEGFWYYIKSKECDDKLRTLFGKKAKDHGRTLTGQWCSNFRKIIVEANFYKIEQNEKLKQMMIESTLPFVHFYLFGPGEIMIHPKGQDWLIHGFEDIRTMLKEGRRPVETDYNQILKKG